MSRHWSTGDGALPDVRGKHARLLLTILVQQVVLHARGTPHFRHFCCIPAALCLPIALDGVAHAELWAANTAIQRQCNGGKEHNETAEREREGSEGKRGNHQPQGRWRCVLRRALRGNGPKGFARRRPVPVWASQDSRQPTECGSMCTMDAGASWSGNRKGGTEGLTEWRSRATMAEDDRPQGCCSSYSKGISRRSPPW